MNSGPNQFVDSVNGQSCLMKIFKEIVENNEGIKIKLDTLADLIMKDLDLKVDHLNNSQLTALPYMLVSYIKKWPGWDKKADYDNGALDIDSWYKRFRYYVTYKMSFLVSKTITSVEDDLQIDNSDSTSKVTKSTQLTNRASFANFTIDVAGPPTLLSNLVFWGNGGNISVEEHCDKPWVILDYVQLLNYPFVEVEFNSPELSFKRSFEPRVNRYISGCADMLYEKPHFILGKHRISTTTPKFNFPVALLDEYIGLYKESMSSQFQIPTNQQEEITAILDQFYKDMVDISTESCVAENRQVTFNMGKNIFKRSKKISNDVDNGPVVIYNEVFLPKITSSFRYFTGLQEYDLEGKRVTTTNNANSLVAMLRFKPVISYKCIYCKLSFGGPEGRETILKHLEVAHRREQPLLCLLCKNSIEVMDLAKQRWKCQCQEI